MKLISVVGARPNFMKIAPFIRAIQYHNSQDNPNFDHILVHTGQHYDDRMSTTFFSSLGIPDPDINLEIGSGSHAFQLGNTMIQFEKVLLEQKPDWVVVVGDVNATLSCSVIAKKMGVKVCHIEAGLRSGDLGMPEEINRLVTDRLSDLLLTPDPLSSENLRKEGIAEEKIHFVGNIMIDTLEYNRTKAENLELLHIVTENRVLKTQDASFSLNDKEYALLTLHRPSNVDQYETIRDLIHFIVDELSREFKVVWPVHPRTLKQLQLFGLWENLVNQPGIIMLEPVDYFEMLRLTKGARILFTDSGGLQEESCVLGIPCLTLRDNTERPITLREFGGLNVLVGNDIERIRREYELTINQNHSPFRPDLWDGETATRIVDILLKTA